jgi:hypothetical protein
MEIFKSDARTISLERYAIRRDANGQPVKIRGWLLVQTPAMKPAEMRIRVDYEYDDIPISSEHQLGRRLLELLGGRIA